MLSTYPPFTTCQPPHATGAAARTFRDTVASFLPEAKDLSPGVLIALTICRLILIHLTVLTRATIFTHARTYKYICSSRSKLLLHGDKPMDAMIDGHNCVWSPCELSNIIESSMSKHVELIHGSAYVSSTPYDNGGQYN